MSRHTLVDRLDTKIQTGKGCWKWTASKDRNGYPQIWAEGRLQYAHRLTYRLVVGEFPADLYIDHLCRNPECTNPSHLEPVTHAENVKRGLAGKLNNARTAQTECKRGHSLLLSSGNVYINKGKRHCRLCRKMHKAQIRAKSKQQKETT